MKGLPFDVWYRIKHFLRPADVENVMDTALAVWQGIFKDNSWLELAKTHDRCVPVLIGPHLSSFRQRKPFNHLYISLLATDHSGDLRYRKDKFFKSLQEGWKYDENNYEISFPSGITVNVYEIFVGAEETILPLEKVFFSQKSGIQTEYLFYGERGFKVLETPNIIGLGGSTHKWRNVKYGYALRLSYQGKLRQYAIAPRTGKTACSDSFDESGMISSYQKDLPMALGRHMARRRQNYCRIPGKPRAFVGPWVPSP